MVLCQHPRESIAHYAMQMAYRSKMRVSVISTDRYAASGIMLYCHELAREYGAGPDITRFNQEDELHFHEVSITAYYRRIPE